MTTPDDQTNAAPKPKRERLTVAQKIARLDAQKRQLLSQAQRAERDLRTRQMVLIGVTVAKAIEDDAPLRHRVLELLAANVTRQTDREALAPWLAPTSTQG